MVCATPPSTVSVEVEQVAVEVAPVPLLTPTALQRVVEVVVSVNVTVPVGLTEPELGVTVAVNVTDCPNVDGLTDEVTVVVVAGLFTVKVAGVVVLLVAWMLLLGK